MIAIVLAAMPGPWFGFGNGYGLAVPYFSARLFWLRDKSGRRAWYTWFGGFGAQMHSYELRAPKAGTEREINGRVYVPFSRRAKVRSQSHEDVLVLIEAVLGKPDTAAAFGDGPSAA